MGLFDSGDASSGGLFDRLNDGLAAGMSSPLFALGTGLIAGAQPFANPGQELQKAAANQQQLAMNRQQMDILRQQMPAVMKALNAVGGLAGPPANAPAAGAPAGGAPPAASMGGPSPLVPPPAVSAPPNRYAPPPPLAPLSSNPVADVNAGTALQISPLFKGLGEALINRPAKLQAAQEALIKQRQQQVAPQLADLDTIMTSADADKRLSSDPDLMALWQRENGGQPLTAPAARAFAGTVYNRLSGATQGAPKPIPTMLETTQRGLGDSYQTDPLTGKITPGSSAVPTDKYIVNGNVVELPKAVGVAKGLTPYDSTLLGAEKITPDALEQAYQLAKTKGDLSESLAGRDPIAAAKVSSYIAQRAKEEGLTGVAMAAQGQSFKSSQRVLTDFLDPAGTAGKKLTAINTTVAHAQTLLPLIDALGTGNVKLINQAKIAYQEATGQKAPTDYKTIANMYAGEASNAITTNGGDKDERESIKAPFSAVNSPTQLKSAIQLTAKALAGKTEALRNQWNVGTQGLQGDFDKLLLPETRAALSGSAHPANIQKLLDKYPGNGRSQ